VIKIEKRSIVKHFPNGISFKYTWRSYQARVLDNLANHLDDGKLHVIAPPGSGKTVLGLEVMLRLNQPTLILAPSIAIKQQWIDRFCELFLQTDTRPDWISTDIYSPAFLTVCTYQGLYAAFTNTMEIEEEEEVEVEESIEKIGDIKQQAKIVETLKNIGIKTVVADEAHHLKNVWWRALTVLVDEIKPKVIGLTATPPYDVTLAEWNRYIDFNGEIDEEITVPELVKEYDLCPHQDYIYFNVPTEAERAVLLKARERNYQLYQTLLEEKVMFNDVIDSTLFKMPEEHLVWIYDNIEYFFACLIFVNHFDTDLAQSRVYILGKEEKVLPVLNAVWMEKVIQFYCSKGMAFFEDKVSHSEKVIKLMNRLRHYGAIEQGQVQLANSQKQNDLLVSSVNKLDSIYQIVQLEYSMLKKSLRLVVLADYIYKEYYVNTTVNDIPLTKLGVMSIFEYLRRQSISKEIKMGVLSGSLILIPQTITNVLDEISVKEIGKNLVYKEVCYDTNYVEVVVNDSNRNRVVAFITQLFERGAIELLIGTKALLGEGWDAPSINTLILASYVGSFVTSNQMRGRAIRSLKDNKEKTSNIWHLVSIDPFVENGGTDIAFLTRRFRGFVGVSNHRVLEDVEISNGTRRLLLTSHLTSIEEIKEENNRTFLYARQRDLLHERWKIGIDKGTMLVNAIEAPFQEKENMTNLKDAEKFYTNKTIRYGISSLMGMITIFLFNQVTGILWNVILQGGITLIKLIWYIVHGGLIGVILKYGRQSWIMFRMAKRYKDVTLDIFPITSVLLSTLCMFDLIRTNQKEFTVICDVNAIGEIHFALKGGTAVERKLYIKCLKELLSPIDNPRYVIERKSFIAFFGTTSDYHAIPECIGLNKKRVNYFEKEWSRQVGKCRVIYTRTLEGRKELLQTRVVAISNQLAEQKITDEDIWK
jgi:superfamily II DNA or RNA helicase